MKSIIKLAAFLFSCSFIISSCSSDWLKTNPTDSTSGDEIFSSTENAKQAINGLCKIMISQHGRYGQSFNGEGSMKLLYGEYPGQDLNFPYMNPGWSPIMNGTITTNTTSKYNDYPWYYYYLIIGNANAIITKIDNAEGRESEHQFIKAEALTFRAYAFSRLISVYCDNWSKSNKGASNGIVLRVDESTGDIPLSTLSESYDQIYKDLDAAIDLYQKSGLTREEVYNKAADTNCFPNENVAYAIYARAALDKEDYSNALKYAKLAKAGYPLMSVNDYRKGFAAPTSEWIWSIYNDENETIYYFGWQVFMACNGNGANSKLNVCINKALIEQFPETDIRKGLFLTESRFLPIGKTYLDVVAGDEAGSHNGEFSDQEAYDKANDYVKSLIKSKQLPAGTPEQAFSYANLKFQATAQPGVGCQPIIRSSEMVLIEAEANYHLNKATDAQANLVELNATSGRQPSYSCSKTNDELLKEIKLYRRLELFGEGFSWFDCKRWNDMVVREGFANGGNYYSSVAGSYGSKESFWKWSIPKRESDYNENIN